MKENPLASTGMLTARDSSAFLGSCAIYGKPELALTAAHCVRHLRPEDIKVVLPAWEGTAGVLAVHCHPRADLAVLRIKHDPVQHASLLPELPFSEVVNLAGVGVDFCAYGFPESQAWGDDKPQATGRLFKGHIQRLFTYTDHTKGYEYVAGEMSIPSPRGLSGGPLFLADDPDKLVGIAAANVYSSTPGEIEGSVSYGVAVVLWIVQVWLDDFVRAVPRG